MFKKVLSSTVSQVASKISTAIISIFLLSILTKYLSIETFGMYSKVYNYLGIFAFMADLGLYTIAVREITHHKDKSAKIIGNIMSLRAILGIAIVFLSIAIAFFLPGYNSALMLCSIGIVGIFTVFSLLNSSLLALMQAHLKIEFSLVSTVTGKLMTLLGVIGIVFFIFPHPVDFSAPILAIFFAGLLGILANTFLNFYYARKICPVGFLYDFQYIKHIVKITIPYGIALFLSVVYFKIDVILLSILEPKKTADISIALYSLPMKIVEVIMVMGGFYLNAILPYLTRAHRDGNTKLFGNIIDFSLRLLLQSAILIFIFGVLFRNEIILLVATPQYLHPAYIYNAADALSIVLLVSGIYFVASVWNYLLIAIHQEKNLLKINIIVTLVNIIGNIIFIPYFSFIGAGVVTVLSQCILLVLGYLVVRRQQIQLPNITGFILYSFALGYTIFFIGKFLKLEFGNSLLSMLCIIAILGAGVIGQFFLLHKKHPLFSKAS